MHARPSKTTDGSGGGAVAPRAIELRGAEPVAYFWENAVVLTGCLMATAAGAIVIALGLREPWTPEAPMAIGFIVFCGLATLIGAFLSVNSLTRERFFATRPTRLIVERDHLTIHGVNRAGEYEYHLDWTPDVHCVVFPVRRAGLFRKISVLEIRTGHGVFRRVRFPRASDHELAGLCRVLDRFFHRQAS